MQSFLKTKSIHHPRPDHNPHPRCVLKTCGTDGVLSYSEKDKDKMTEKGEIKLGGCGIRPLPNVKEFAFEVTRKKTKKKEGEKKIINAPFNPRFTPRSPVKPWAGTTTATFSPHPPLSRWRNGSLKSSVSSRSSQPLPRKVYQHYYLHMNLFGRVLKEILI